ncbi:MAG: ATP-binding protein [Steroidobacteraceae bacterium]
MFQLFYQFVHTVEDHAIFAMDPLGNIVHWNAGAERIMGFAASDVLGRELNNIFTEEQGVVRIHDTGVGIPPGQLAEIFELFTQVHPDNVESRAGMGIGLALARELVELHGGTIQARSDGVGKGSEFIVRLPLRE